AVSLAPLREPCDARQELLRLGRAIDRRARLEAVVARAAVAREDFAEMAQLQAAATFGGFRIVETLTQLLPGDALFVDQRVERHGVDFLIDDEFRGAD